MSNENKLRTPDEIKVDNNNEVSKFGSPEIMTDQEMAAVSSESERKFLGLIYNLPQADPTWDDIREYTRGQEGLDPSELEKRRSSMRLRAAGLFGLPRNATWRQIRDACKFPGLL